MGFAEA
jgi:hypothetical protein